MQIVDILEHMHEAGEDSPPVDFGKVNDGLAVPESAVNAGRRTIGVGPGDRFMVAIAEAGISASGVVVPDIPPREDFEEGAGGRLKHGIDDVGAVQPDRDADVMHLFYLLGERCVDRHTHVSQLHVVLFAEALEHGLEPGVTGTGQTPP